MFEALDTRALQGWLEGIGDKAAAHAPSVLSGAGVLVVGWLVAKLLRSALRHMLRVVRLDAAVQGTRLQSLLGAIHKDLTPSSVVATLAYWTLLLVAWNTAAGIWGLTALENALSAAVGYLPKALSALALFAGGAYLAGAARRAVGAILRELRNPAAAILESVTEGALLLVVSLVTLDLLGANLSFITANLTLVVGAGLVVVVFLSCWSMRAPAEQIVANYYIRRMLSIGDQVETDQHRGTILEFVPLGLVLRDPTGDEHFVPARSLLAGLRRRQAVKPEDPVG
ncbi:MAG TPA: hypothetical protein VI197_25530 [Polyangiaceae bacterium]